MPQLENGYTKIANELLEAIAAIRIPGEAMQVLLVIIRKTYGYCKKKDAISLSQFVSATGMKKPNICRAVKKLLDMNIIKPLSKKIIKIIEKDNAYISEYELNKDCASWKPLSKKITLSKKIKNVIEKDNLPLSKKIPTKETITKEKTNSNEIIEKPKKKKTPDAVDSEFINKLKALYPAINVEAEKRKADAWLLCNPGRVMTRRFFNNWLSRAKPEQTSTNVENEIERLYGGKA